MKIQKRMVWLFLGLLNAVVLLFHAAVIWNSSQPEVGAAWNHEEKSEDRLVQVYSTSAMEPGVYRVSVHYTAEDGSYTLSGRAKGDGGSYPIIFADQYRMDPAKNYLSFNLWVNSGIDYLLMEVETEKPDSEIVVDSIMLKRQFRETFVYLMLRGCAMLLLADIAVIAVWKRRKLVLWLRENFYTVVGLLGILGISSACVLSDSQIEGHDLQFHLARIAGLAEGLLSGEFPVRIQPGWCNGYGYAASVFYGDALLYLPAVLYAFGVPLIYAYKVYVFLINAGTVGIAYYCYRRLCHDRYIGLVCTALSTLSLNRILNVYVRAAVGEYSAYMFLPLVLLGMKEILCPETGKARGKNGWLYLGIGMTGVLQTHILSFEMICIVLGITVAALAGRMVRQGSFREILKGAVLAVLLCAGFIVPFLDYSRQGLAVFNGKYEYGIQGFGLTLYELFSLPTEGAGHALRSEAGFDGRFPVSLGLGMLAMMVLMAWALVKIKWEKSERRPVLFAAGLACICIWMATCYFPWNRLAEVPGVRNLVASIQIPWRFLSPGIPILTYAAGMTLQKIQNAAGTAKTRYLLAGLYMVTAVQGMYCMDLVVRAENLVIYDGSMCLRADYTLMGGEYLFQDTDRDAAQEDREIRGQNVAVADVRSEGNRMTAACVASADAYLEFPRFAYDYYRCIDVETGREFPVTKGSNHKIRVDLPADYRGTLKVFFKEPWYWRAAEGISGCTLVLVCVLLFLSYHGVTRETKGVHRPVRESIAAAVSVWEERKGA